MRNLLDFIALEDEKSRNVSQDIVFATDILFIDVFDVILRNYESIAFGGDGISDIIKLIKNILLAVDPKMAVYFVFEGVTHMYRLRKMKILINDFPELIKIAAPSSFLDGLYSAIKHLASKQEIKYFLI